VLAVPQRDAALTSSTAQLPPTPQQRCCARALRMRACGTVAARLRRSVTAPAGWDHGKRSYRKSLVLSDVSGPYSTFRPDIFACSAWLVVAYNRDKVSADRSSRHPTSLSYRLIVSVLKTSAFPLNVAFSFSSTVELFARFEVQLRYLFGT